MKTSVATALLLLSITHHAWAQELEIAPPPTTPAPVPATPAPAPAPSPSPAAAAPAAAAPRPAAGEATLASYRPNQTSTIDAYIGRVNAEPIFASDLFRSKDVDERLKRLAQTARTLPEFERAAREILRSRLSQLYAEALVLSAADAALTPDERARIDDYINVERNKIISKFGGSAAAADKALAAEGSSLAQEVNEQKKSFKKQLYFSRTIAQSIEVTQDMARAAYDKTPDKWKQQAQTQIFTITIPVSRWLRETLPSGEAGPVINNATEAQIRAAEAEAMKTAQEITAKLKAGGDFARLAAEYNSADDAKTDGGKWKPLTRGTLRDTKWE
jgi:hypothetical protein